MAYKKRKRSVLKSFVTLLIILVALCISGYYIENYFIRPSSIRYPEFGIDIPANYPIHGIDVSRYQQVIDWEDVKAMNVKNIRIGFAYIKATEGVDQVDEQFRRNWFEAEEQGMTKGAYHFFEAGKSGRQQAKNFIAIVQLKKGDLPPVLDVEDANNASPEDIKKEIAEWLTLVEKHYHITPVIYSNIDFYNIYIRESFKAYPFWVAHYLQPGKPRIEGNWSFWQHSEKGRVDGIKTTVDFNVFSGDSLDFQEFLIK